MRPGWPPGHRVMVTGHRDVRGARADQVRAIIHQVMERLAARHPEGLVAVCGMAVGADIEFADVALGLGIPLVAALPTDTQESPWPEWARVRYRKALAQAYAVVNVWEEPDYAADDIRARFHTRNRWMVDHTEGGVTLAIWDGRKSGGTWAAVREVLRRGRKVLVVDPGTGRLRVEEPRSEMRHGAKATNFGNAYGFIRNEYERLGGPVPEGSVLDMFAKVQGDTLDSLERDVLEMWARVSLDDLD